MVFPAGTRVQINPEYTQEIRTVGKVFEVVEYHPSEHIMGSKYTVRDDNGVERDLREGLLVEVEAEPEHHLSGGDLATVSYMAAIIQQHSIAAFSHDYGSAVRIAKPTLHCECGETFEGMTFAAHATHIATELYNAGLR